MTGWLRTLLLRARALWRADQIHDEIDEELRFHVQMRTEENLRRGMHPDDARRDAERRFGNLTRAKELAYDVRGARWLEASLQDARYAARRLAKSPGFAAVAVVTLALGVGANTAIFSVTNAVLLRPLPFDRPEQLVTIWETNVGFGTAGPGASPPDFREWRDRTRAFARMSAYFDRYANLSGAGEPERLLATHVSTDFFETLGVSPALGRGFLPEEEQFGAHRVAVLSHGLWQRRLGGDPGVVGRAVSLNGEPYTIVGVAPPDFRFADPDTQLWLPMSFAPDDNDNTRGNHFLGVVARLAPGVGIEQAQADLDAVTRRLAEELPENAGVGARALPLHEEVVSGYRTALLVLSGAVGLVLLVACVNVANLLLAQSAGRRRELALRSALGARPGRLARQLLTESVILSLAGAALGVLLAVWGVRALVALGPADLPRASEIGVDLAALAFTLAVSLVTGLGFGLVPALHAFRSDPGEALKEGGRTTAGGAGARRVRRALVASEIGLSLVLLVGAGLLVHSFWNLRRVDAGFDPGRVLTVQLALPEPKYSSESGGAPSRSFFRELIDRTEALPGVERVGATTALPFAAGGWGKLVTIQGRPEPASLEAVPLVQYRQVSAGYFEALGARLVAGRFFTDRDDENAPPAAVINEEMARRFWPGEDPLGKRLYMGPPEHLVPAGILPEGYTFPRLTVVGVVGDVRHRGLDRTPLPEVYVPHPQGAGETSRNMFLVVRSASDPSALAAAVRSQVAAIDKDQPVADVRTMEERLSGSLAPARFIMLLVGVFAASALVMAAVGLYGVIAQTVAQRTHEIGIRMAVGARARDVLALVMREGMLLALAGIGAGVVAALALSRALSSLLFGVSATDPLTFSAVALLLAAVAAVACYVPARRAVRVDPAVVLRND